MQLGIFAKTFARPGLDQVLDAVLAHGLSVIQFNFACAGLESMPKEIAPEHLARIGRAISSRGISVAAVSGTFNIAHPDPSVRADGMSRFRVVAGACRALGTSLVTICTGTRHPTDMWTAHPLNETPAAWKDMCRSLDQMIEIAEKHDIYLGVEPEISNIICSAMAARRLLDQYRSARLRIVIDPANLFPSGTLGQMQDILHQALDLLGPDIAMAHAKDLHEDGHAGHCAAGRGKLDYGLFLRLLKDCGFDGPLILHGLSEAEVPGSVAFLQNKLGQSA